MASGDTLLIFGPLHNEPPSSDAATFDTRNLHPVLDFDASTDESAVFSSIICPNTTRARRASRSIFITV